MLSVLFKLSFHPVAEIAQRISNDRKLALNGLSLSFDFNISFDPISNIARSLNIEMNLCSSDQTAACSNKSRLLTCYKATSP